MKISCNKFKQKKSDFVIDIEKACQTGGPRAKCGCDVIFCGPPKDFLALYECLTSEFRLQKVALQKKKNF